MGVSLLLLGRVRRAHPTVPTATPCDNGWPGGHAVAMRRIGQRPEAVLRQGVHGQPDRPRRDGRLQPAALDLPGRADRALRGRPGALLAGARAVGAGRPAGAVPERHRRRRCRRRCARSAARRRPSGSSRSSPACGSPRRSGARWTPRSAASTACRAAPGCARSSSASGCSASCCCSSPRRSPCRRCSRCCSREARTCRSACRAATRCGPISLGAGLVINFVALATIYRTVPNTPVALARRVAGRARGDRRDLRHRLRLPVLPHERLDLRAACARRWCSS